MSEIQYDLAIIGAGPGGYHAAIRAAQYGAKVALIEKDKLGGTCLNWGCIPTKALYASAQLIEKIKEATEFGIEISEYKLSFAKAVERKNEVVKELVEGIAALEKGWKNDVYYGFGKIVGGNTDDGFEISIEDQNNTNIKAKRVIIATGSSPAMIPTFNIDHDRILTSDDILDPEFKIVPERLLIIGAGVVGCEFANIFATFGSKVVMLEYLPNPIATEETLIIKELQKKITSLGIELHVSQKVCSLENTGSGVKATTCSADVPRDQVESAEKFYFEAIEILENQEIIVNPGTSQDAEIVMSGDNNAITKICQGKGDFTHAISREEITVEKGKVIDVIRLTRAITIVLKTK